MTESAEFADFEEDSPPVDDMIGDFNRQSSYLGMAQQLNVAYAPKTAVSGVSSGGICNYATIGRSFSTHSPLHQHLAQLSCSDHQKHRHTMQPITTTTKATGLITAAPIELAQQPYAHLQQNNYEHFTLFTTVGNQTTSLHSPQRLSYSSGSGQQPPQIIYNTDQSQQTTPQHILFTNRVPQQQVLPNVHHPHSILLTSAVGQQLINQPPSIHPHPPQQIMSPVNQSAATFQPLSVQLLSGQPSPVSMSPCR